MPVFQRRPRINALLLLVAAVSAAGLLLTGTAAAADKPYSVVLAPAELPAGRTAVVTATFTNLTSSQQLGSAELEAPTALRVLDAGSATVRGQVIQLRELALAPGESIQVAVRVDVGCAAGAYAWAVQAKQANNFSGPPGNDLDLDESASSLATTVSGSCALRFLTQPQDARVGERITGLDFDPAGPPVSVEVVDGAGERVTGSSAPVTLALATVSGFGRLGGTVTVAAAAGVATFGDLSIDAAGAYRLFAAAPGLQPDVSAVFTIQQVAVRCLEDVNCSTGLATARSSVAITAFANGGLDAGFLQLSLNAGFRPDCAGYAEYSADWAAVLGPDRRKLVTFTIDKRVMNASPNNGASFLQMCFAAPFRFATRAGTPLAELDTDGIGGPDLFQGLLPDCGTEPCVSARRKNRAGDGIVEVRAPGGVEDPAYRP